MPRLVEAQEQFGEQGLAIVGVTKADSFAIQGFQEELGASYPILAEGDANFTSFEVSRIPATFLLDANGELIASGLDESLAAIAERMGG